MREHSHGTTRRDGHYSRKRLTFVAAAWVAAAVVALVASGGFGATAQDPAGCSAAPCAFPAESNIGGIVMGTDYIQGQNLVAFGVGREPALTDQTAPDAVAPAEETIILGLNDISSGSFFIYKSFRYFDERVGTSVPVYIWTNATSATLSGSPGSCGNGNQGPAGSDNCDLQAGTSEMTTRYFEGHNVNNGCSGHTCSMVPNTISSTEFWAVRPEDDICGAAGALAGAICLGLVTDGGTTAAGATITTDGVTISSSDFMVRGHEFESVNDTDGTDHKTMSLTDVYIEMRYGVGEDRINKPISTPPDTAPSGATIPQGTDWAQNTSGPYGDAALAVDFLCEGGGPLTNCVIPPEYSVDQGDISYNNPYRPAR